MTFLFNVQIFCILLNKDGYVAQVSDVVHGPLLFSQNCTPPPSFKKWCCMNWEGSSARHRFTFINSFFMQLTKKTYSFNGNFNHTCHIVLIIIEGAHIHKEKYNWDPSLGLRAIYIYVCITNYWRHMYVLDHMRRLQRTWQEQEMTVPQL